MPARLPNGSFDTVLCPDGSPNAKVSDELTRATPRLMALQINPGWPVLVQAICGDLESGSTPALISQAYSWQSAALAWTNLPSGEELSTQLGAGLCIDQQARAAGRRPGQAPGLSLGATASLSLAEITVAQVITPQPGADSSLAQVQVRVQVCAKEPIVVSQAPWLVRDIEGGLNRPRASTGTLPGEPYPSALGLEAGECLSGWLAFDSQHGWPWQVHYVSPDGQTLTWSA